MSVTDMGQRVEARLQAVRQNRMSIRLADGLTEALASYVSDQDAYGRAMAFVVDEITRLVEFFNVAKGMTGEQIVDAVEIMLHTYTDLSMEDMVVFARSAKAGFITSPARRYDYDKIFGRLDGSVLMGWLKTYYEAKIDQREANIHNEQFQWEDHDPEAAARFREMWMSMMAANRVPTPHTSPEEIFEEQVAAMIGQWPQFTEVQRARIIMSASETGHGKLVKKLLELNKTIAPAPEPEVVTNNQES